MRQAFASKFGSSHMCIRVRHATADGQVFVKAADAPGEEAVGSGAVVEP